MNCYLKAGSDHLVGEEGMHVFRTTFICITNLPFKKNPGLCVYLGVIWQLMEDGHLDQWTMRAEGAPSLCPLCVLLNLIFCQLNYKLDCLIYL